MTPGTQTQPGNATGNSPLHGLLIQQGQSIHRLHETLHSYSVAYGLKVFLSIVLQIVCYLLFAFGIYIAITIPTDLPNLIYMMGGESPLLNFIPTPEELTMFLMSIKIIIAIISLPVLICALLLGRNRRKSRRIRKAFQEVETMKVNYEETMRSVRF